MRKLIFLITLIYPLLYLTHINAVAQDTTALVPYLQRDSLILRGDSLFGTGTFEDAIVTYKKILKMNGYDTLALSRLGRVAYLKEDWGNVKEYYNKILEYDDSHTRAHYYLGIAYRETGKFKALLLRKRDWDKSQRHFEYTLKKDSLFGDVLYQYAVLWRYREKYRRALTMAQRQITLKPELTLPQVKIFRLYRYFFTHRDEKTVREWADQNPTNHAQYALGEKWRRQGELSKADSLFNEILQDTFSISSSPVLLSQVRIHTEREQFKQADSCFWVAVRRIKNQVDADLIMEDLKYLLTEPEWRLYISLYAVPALKKFIQNFWMKRNPLPANDWNVRLVEHYKRMNYAEKYYEYDDFRGWFMDPDQLQYLEYPITIKLNQEFNDKGLIYIRHGKPNETAVTVGGEDVPINESWLYYQNSVHPRMTFHFMTGKPGNDWRFAPFVTHPAMLEDRLIWGNIYYQLLRAGPLEILQYQQEMADISQQSISHALSTDRHSWKENLKPLDIPLTIHTFRGEKANTLIELSYAIPPPSEFQETTRTLTVSKIWYEIGMVFFDRNISEMIRSRDSLSLETQRDSVYIGLYRFTLPPDSYLVGFHVEPQEFEYLGGYRFRVNIDDYADSDLQMSQIQLATKIKPARDSTKFVKHGLEIIPNPSTKFSQKELLFSYVEVYNLNTDSEGKSQFTIEYSLTHTNPSKRKLTNLFGLLGGGKPSSISIQSEREGSSELSIEHIALDVSNLQKGNYELTIRIRDELSDVSTERETDLILY